MHEIGLYHPRIHFPSDNWIKTAALYWTKMARVVPPNFVPRDSETVRTLRDELDFVVNISTDASDHYRWGRGHWDACEEFAGFIEDDHVELRKLYGTDKIPGAAELPGEFESWNDPTGEALVAEVAEPKIAWHIRQSLVRHELAIPKPRRDDFMDTPGLVMHPSLARLYMSALADDLARTNHLLPITDDHDMFSVASGWTKDRMRNLLLPPGTHQVRPNDDDTWTRYAIRMGSPWRPGARPDLIGMVAVQLAIPRDMTHIPVGQIIKVRKDFAPQFLVFRETVETLAKDVNGTLEAVQDANVARAYLAQAVDEKLLAPVRELREQLRTMSRDTITTTLTFKYEVPALASLVAGGVFAHEPLLAGGAAVAAGLLGLVKGARRDSSDRRLGSPVSYLMLLQDELGAESALRRTAARIRAITGLPTGRDRE